MRNWCLAVVVSLCLENLSRADGLIYQLPPDGAWAVYTFEQQSEIEYHFKQGAAPAARVTETAPRTAIANGFLVIRSVGREGEDADARRWIEIEQSVQLAGKSADDREVEPLRRTITLKLLIPELRLTAGEDPFAHVLKMLFKDGDRKADEVADEKRRQYELDRFRPLFPAPADKPTRTAGQVPPTDQPEVAKMKCELLTFPSEYDGPLSGGKSGRWTYKGEHRVWLSEQAPFGVAALQFVSTSKEESGGDTEVATTTTGTRKLVLVDFGTKAKSRLSDGK